MSVAAFYILVAGPVLTIVALALAFILLWILVMVVGGAEGVAAWIHGRRTRAAKPVTPAFHKPVPHF